MLLYRDFLRLGAPLCCATEADVSPDLTNDVEDSLVAPPPPVSDAPPPDRSPQRSSGLISTGEGVPLTRVKCLVSMTTPRDVRLHGASITPSFIEFDMSSEGFG